MAKSNIKEEKTLNNNKVMATVDSQPITMADVLYFIQSMGPQGAQYNNEQGYKLIVEQLITQRLLFIDASKNGMAFEKDYKEQLEIMKRDLLTSYALNKLLASVEVTSAQCKEEYMKDPAKYSDQEKVSASHILVDSEEKANEILKKINDGEVSFEDAAKDNSSCPSSQSGGVLGEFARGSMVPEFEQAAFSMELDTVSEPVKTQFGYHLIKVTDKKEAQPMSFEDAEESIKQQLTADVRQKALESKVTQLKILYPVDVVDNGSGIIL